MKYRGVMKLSDLKAGEHIVEVRNGWRYLVLKGDHGLFLSRERGCIPELTSFNEDMIHFNSSNELDIVKVFSLTPGGLRDSFDLIRDDKPIWERGEKKPNTDKEAIVNKMKQIENELRALKTALLRGDNKNAPRQEG